MNLDKDQKRSMLEWLSDEECSAKARAAQLPG